MGTEGDGLADQTIAGCDYTVKIQMYHGVDSLNVAAASAVAFYQLANKQNKRKKQVFGVVPVRIQRQFYSPYGEFYCFAVLLCFAQCYLASPSYPVNKISLKPKASISLLPQGNNITLP